jgi:molecular chaperone HscB
MSSCPSCRASLLPGSAICPHCGALQPFDPNLSLFAVLGLTAGFSLDPAELRKRVLERQQLLHPDRFAQADSAQQRQSLEWSTRINEAQAVLGDPLRRADYLFQQRFGHSALGEEMGSLRDPELLLREMERREALEDAVAIRDQAQLDRLRAEANAEEQELTERMATAFAAPQEAQIARLLQEWQYLRKFLAEIDANEERWDYA